MPSSIGNFGSIKYMSFWNNYIGGTIPSTISGLTSLQTLDLDGNSLVGTIPSTIGRLISLQTLWFKNNLLSGTIPSTMSALTSLGYLYSSNNYLTMGGATSVPISTFSSYTLSGYIDLADNCLVFDTTSPYPYRHVTATHCRSTGKYEVWCQNFQYSIVIISLVISELISFMYCVLCAANRRQDNMVV